MTLQPTTPGVAAIRHLAFEDLGAFAPVFESRGLAIDYYDVGVDDITVPIGSAGLVVVLGGPVGVYETDHYPFLVEERELLRRRLEAGRPTLGICLGAQLIAAALGGRVYPGNDKEIGWAPVELSDQGRDSCLSGLNGAPVLHWHGDTFDLPAACRRLAGTATYPNQAFDLGQNILGLQFHAEIDPARFEQWLIGHSCELKGAAIDPVVLREQTEVSRSLINGTGPRLLHAWLDRVEW